jgi:hypothetical protein
MKRILFLIFIIAFALFLIIARRGKYEDFYNTNFNGTIDTIYRYRSYVMFYVNKKEFRIIPIALKNEPELDEVAKIGDSLFKKSNSDTLNLIHQGSKYLYTVQKW